MNKKVILVLLLSCIFCMSFPTTPARANGVRDQVKFLEEEPHNDIFGAVTNTVEDVGRSSVKLVRTGGIVILSLSIFVIAITIAVTKNSTKKEEAKGRLVAYAIGAVLFFGGASAIIWAGDIGAAVTASAKAIP